MDVRPIDANALKEALKDMVVTSGPHPQYIRGAQACIDKFFPQIIDEQPTIELAQPQPVTKESPARRTRRKKVQGK